MGRIVLLVALTIWSLVGCSKNEKVEIIIDTHLYSIAPLRPDDEAGKVLLIIPKGEILPLYRRIQQKDFLVLQVKYKNKTGYIIFDSRNVAIVQHD